MTTDQIIKKAKELNQLQAIALAGKTIADAIDRYTELQRLTVNSQLEAASKGSDLMETMLKMVKRESGADEDWREPDDED